MIKGVIIALYIGIKMYLLFLIIGGVVLYFFSPQFREFIVVSSSYKEILEFIHQVKVINLNVPLSNKERAISYLGFILIGV